MVSLLALPAMLTGGVVGPPGTTWFTLAALVLNVVMLAGLLLGVALYFNFRNLAFRLPRFSSPLGRTRNLAWGGYIRPLTAY